MPWKSMPRTSALRKRSGASIRRKLRALRPASPRTRAWKLGALTFGLTQLVLLFWWIAFFPGLMSYDSVMYIWQATTSNWSTSHSVAYNSLLWLSLQLSGEVALLTLAQATWMAAGLAYAVVGLRRLRVPGRWLAIAAAVAVCLPVVGTFTVYVSKDAAFVICEVWLLGTVARLVANRVDGSTVAPKRLLWTLFAEFALMALFRPNGFVVIALATVGLAAVLSGVRWRLAACGLAAIAVGFVANVAVYPALGVRPAGSELVLGPAYADLAVAFKQRPSVFHAADRALLAEVAPLSYWRSTANCYSADATVAPGRPQFSLEAARTHQAELFNLWLTILKRAPDVITQARLCRGSIAWNPFPGPAEGWTVKIPIEGVTRFFEFPAARIAQSPYRDAVHRAPPSDTALQTGVFLRRLSDTRSFEWFLWRGATWAYVSYVAVFLFARRRRSVAVMALVAVIVANQITVAVNNPNQLVRYMVGPLILGILLLPLAFVSRARLSPAGTGDEAGKAGEAGRQASREAGDAAGVAARLGRSLAWEIARLEITRLGDHSLGRSLAWEITHRMLAMDGLEIAHRRLHNQHLAGGRLIDPVAVVRHLGAMQSQEYALARWSIGQRTHGFDDAAVQSLVDDGRILRTHVLRPTWHFVAADDIAWIQALTSPRVHVFNAYYNRQHGLDEDHAARANRVICNALRGGNHLTRLELAHALALSGLEATGNRLAYVVMRAELDGLIANGPMRGKQQTYALISERAPHAAALEPEEALAEITRRYFVSHGPATIKDFSWWSSLTTTQIKRGLAILGSDLASELVDGVTYWFAPTAASPRERSPTAHVLQAYDEYTVAYTESRAVTNVAGVAVPSPSANTPGHSIIVDSQLMGLWRRLTRGRGVEAHTALARHLSSAQRRAIDTAFARYAAFAGVPVTVN